MEINERIERGDSFSAVYGNIEKFLKDTSCVVDNTKHEIYPIGTLRLEHDNEGNGFCVQTGLFGTARSCSPDSIQSFMERACLGKAQLGFLPREELINIINTCYSYVPETKGTTIVTIGDKVYAALSDDYQVIDANMVFNEAVCALIKNNGKFISGYITTSLFSGTWAINNPVLIEKYRNAVSGDFDWNISPVVTVETSNVGYSAVNIIPKFKRGKTEFIIGKPLSVLHKGESNIDNVHEKMNQIYSLMNTSIENLNKMKTVILTYPINTFKNVAKAIGLQKKYVALALQDFESLIDDGSTVSAFDVYMGLTEVLNYFSSDETKKRSLADMQEIIARALTCDWKSYDTPVSGWEISTMAI